LVLRNKEDDVFGFKIDPHRLFQLEKVLDLHKTFSGRYFKWIDLRRWNVVKQAFSYTRARKTGVWHMFSGADSGGVASTTSTVEVVDQEVWADIKRIITAEQSIEKYYSNRGILPMRAFYEELYDSKQEFLSRVLYEINPDRVWAGTELAVDQTRKISNEINAEMEFDFFKRNINTLSRMMSQRGVIDVTTLG
jgi:LPS sulfotransferase NodH